MSENQSPSLQPATQNARSARILHRRVAYALLALLCSLVAIGAILIHLLPLLSATHEQTPSLHLRPGWKQVAIASGTGTSTIHVHWAPPSLWALVVTCTGGTVNITLVGTKSTTSIGTDDCHSPQLSLAQPTTLFYGDHTPDPIHTLTVHAAAHTSWQLHLLQATVQPTFRLGSQWTPVVQSTSGSGTTFTRTSPHDPWQPHSPILVIMTGDLTGQPATTTRTVGIVTLCFGTGIEHVLFPDGQTIATPACTGQPTLTPVHFSKPTTLQHVQIVAGGTLTWWTAIVACRDETRCQFSSHAGTTPTPERNDQ